jgi:hypothetical protein
MAFDVSALTNYVDEQRLPLVARAVASGATIRMGTQLWTGVKGETAVNKLGTDIFFQDASGCGFNASGDVKFTQRKLKPGYIKLDMEFCPKVLKNKWASTQLALGIAGNQEMPFEQEIMNMIMDEVNSKVEQMLWRSDSVSGTGNFQFFDGFVKAIEENTNYVDANVAGAFATPLTAFTAATMTEAIQRLAYHAPEGIQEKADTKMYVGIDKFNLLNANLLNGGTTFGQLAHQGLVRNDGVKRMTWPGTDIEIIGLSGLSNLNKVYVGSLSNMFIGFDAAEDINTLDVWYSKDDRKIYLTLEFTLATQVAYQDEFAAIVLP